MNPEENKDLDGHFITELVEDFGALVKNGVEWKSALLHVLDIALEVSEENTQEYLETVLDDVYRQGFRNGVKSGIEGSASVLLEHLDDVEDAFEMEGTCDCDTCDNSCNEETPEELEVVDLTKDQFDIVQKLIQENKSDE